MKTLWLKIFFVLVLPIVGNLILIFYFERGVCRIELPAREHQEYLQKCADAMSNVDPLSRLSPGLANLLRYDFSIKNNWRPVNGATSTLVFLVQNEKTGEQNRVSSNESAIIWKSLERSEVVDKLKNYTPVVELPLSGGSNAGGWGLSYRPDALSVFLQFIITLLVWFQIVEIYMFLKSSVRDGSRNGIK